MAGFVLGPLGFGWLAAKGPLATFENLTVLILMAAGLETDWREVKHTLKGKGIALGVLGFLLPLTVVFGVALLFGATPVRSLVLSLCVSISSVPVISKFLNTSTKVAEGISRYATALAVVNNILALALFGVVLNHTVGRRRSISP